MKIDYKITTIVLGVLLVFTYIFQWNNIFHSNSQKTEMHKMPNGEMMYDDHDMGMGSMTMDQMAEDLKGKTGKDLEKAFILGMIPHHQGAVEMSKILLQDKTISLKMKSFAENIIKAQESEIDMMDKWLLAY